MLISATLNMLLMLTSERTLRWKTPEH
jgi:hypothetical protein